MQLLNKVTQFQARTKSLGGTPQTIKIQPSNYLAGGGEANVYTHKSSVIKIFHEDDRFQRDGFAAKMEAMLPLKHESIIFPTHIISYKNNDVGIALPKVDGYQLLEYSEIPAWDNFNFKLKDAISIVNQMLDVTLYAHENEFIMRDANARNWLIEKNATKFKARIIDVDGWDFKQWKALEILENIRDTRTPHNEFTELTDTYAWAVNAFTLLTGVHPYSGKAPNYGRKEMAKRRADLISLLNKSASPPKNYREFKTHIPDEFKPIFYQMFEKGKNFTAKELKSEIKGTNSLTYDMSLFVKTQAHPRQMPDPHPNTHPQVKLKYEPVYQSADNPPMTISHSGFVYLRNNAVFDLQTHQTFNLPSLKGDDTPYLHRSDDPNLLLAVNKERAESIVHFAFFDYYDLTNNIKGTPSYGTESLPSDKFFIANNVLYNIYHNTLSRIDYTYNKSNKKIDVRETPVGVYNPNTLKAYGGGAAISNGVKNQILIFDPKSNTPTTRFFHQLDNKQILYVNASIAFIFVHCVDKSTGLLEDHIFTLTDTDSFFCNDNSYTHTSKVVDTGLQFMMQYNEKVAWINRDNQVCILSTKNGATLNVPESVPDLRRFINYNNFVYVLQNSANGAVVSRLSTVAN